jgi:hypothetical protein
MAALSSEQQHDIQGFGLAGFRKDHQLLVGVVFPTPEAGRKLIGRLAGMAASLWEVRRFNQLFSEIRKRTGEERIVEATWRALRISGKGYQALGVDLSGLPDGEGRNAFAAGMAQRAEQVGDDAVDDLDKAVDRTEKLIENTGCEKVWSEGGARLPVSLRGKEHFGFKDGISRWLVETEAGVDAWTRRLASVIDSDDRRLIVKLEDRVNGSLGAADWAWINARVPRAQVAA